MSTEARPEVASLSAKQSERRQRVIAAAMSLAEEGGYLRAETAHAAARAMSASSYAASLAALLDRIAMTSGALPGGRTMAMSLAVP